MCTHLPCPVWRDVNQVLSVSERMFGGRHVSSVLLELLLSRSCLSTRCPLYFIPITRYLHCAACWTLPLQPIYTSGASRHQRPAGRFMAADRTPFTAATRSASSRQRLLVINFYPRLKVTAGNVLFRKKNTLIQRYFYENQEEEKKNPRLSVLAKKSRRMDNLDGEMLFTLCTHTVCRVGQVWCFKLNCPAADLSVFLQ